MPRVSLVQASLRIARSMGREYILVVSVKMTGQDEEAVRQLRLPGQDIGIHFSRAKSLR